MHRYSADFDDHSDNESPASVSSNDVLNQNTHILSSKLPMQNDCAVGHRVQASRSVLAVALDKDCVFAGLQGGDILVCTGKKYIGNITDKLLGLVFGHV
jgi:di- and tripeptidase